MSARRDAETRPAEPRVTLDDIRHRAELVKSKAVAEAKGAVDVVVGDEKRALLIAAGVVLVVASIAYYLGTRAARASYLDEILGE